MKIRRKERCRTDIEMEKGVLVRRFEAYSGHALKILDVSGGKSLRAQNYGAHHSSVDRRRIENTKGSSYCS